MTEYVRCPDGCIADDLEEGCQFCTELSSRDLAIGVSEHGEVCPLFLETGNKITGELSLKRQEFAFYPVLKDGDNVVATFRRGHITLHYPYVIKRLGPMEFEVLKGKK